VAHRSLSRGPPESEPWPTGVLAVAHRSLSRGPPESEPWPTGVSAVAHRSLSRGPPESQPWPTGVSAVAHRSLSRGPPESQPWLTGVRLDPPCSSQGSGRDNPPTVSRTAVSSRAGYPQARRKPARAGHLRVHLRVLRGDLSKPRAGTRRTPAPPPRVTRDHAPDAPGRGRRAGLQSSGDVQPLPLHLQPALAPLVHSDSSGGPGRPSVADVAQLFDCRCRARIGAGPEWMGWAACAT
jgi:hypothetical protein